MICSALFYPYSFARGDLGVREGRFHPGKFAETFPVWWQYLRRHYPDEPVVLFADASSPAPLRSLLRALPEQWAEVGLDGVERIHDDSSGFDWTEPKVTVRWLDQHAASFSTSCTHFRPMQRNLVAAMVMAYEANEDLLWIDNDCFCNTNVRPLIEGYDFAAPRIAHKQQTADSIFTYISAERLHAYDHLCKLPDYLERMVNEGPTETRMHSLQEGGLYKLFCFGKTRRLGGDIELTHLSTYKSFMTFLRRNSLDTKEYHGLVSALESFDLTRLKGVDLEFGDMLCPEGHVE